MVQPSNTLKTVLNPGLTPDESYSIQAVGPDEIAARAQNELGAQHSASGSPLRARASN
jgi:hypothetical protein